MVFKSTRIDGNTSGENLEREDVLEQVLGFHHLKARDRRTCKEDEESGEGVEKCKKVGLQNARELSI